MYDSCIQCPQQLWLLRNLQQTNTVFHLLFVYKEMTRYKTCTHNIHDLRLTWTDERLEDRRVSVSDCDTYDYFEELMKVLLSYAAHPAYQWCRYISHVWWCLLICVTWFVSGYDKLPTCGSVGLSFVIWWGYYEDMSRIIELRIGGNSRASRPGVHSYVVNLTWFGRWRADSSEHERME